MVDFSQRLKKVRTNRHLTQAQMARKIGVTASMVSSETGRAVRVNGGVLYGLVYELVEHQEFSFKCVSASPLSSVQYPHEHSYRLGHSSFPHPSL